MSPEFFDNNDYYDPIKNDIWQLGLLFDEFFNERQYYISYFSFDEFK